MCGLFKRRALASPTASHSLRGAHRSRQTFPCVVPSSSVRCSSEAAVPCWNLLPETVGMTPNYTMYPLLRFFLLSSHLSNLPHTEQIGKFSLAAHANVQVHRPAINRRSSISSSRQRALSHKRYMGDSVAAFFRRNKTNISLPGVHRTRNVVFNEHVMFLKHRLREKNAAKSIQRTDLGHRERRQGVRLDPRSIISLD